MPEDVQMNDSEPQSAAPAPAAAAAPALSTLHRKLPHSFLPLSQTLEFSIYHLCVAEAALMSDLKEIASVIEAGSLSKEVRRISRAFRLTVALRRRLAARDVSAFLAFALPASSEAYGRLIALVPKEDDTEMDVDAVAPATQISIKHGLPEIEIYCYLLALIFLIDQKKYDEVHLEPLIFLMNLLALHRMATLHRDELGQETLLNLLLRNYLHYNLYDQAEKLRSKAPRFEAHSNQQFCRYLFYLGKIRTIQLEYTDAKESLLQAARKAPTTARGFRIQCNKWAIIVRLLLGEIPERTVFMQKGMKKALTPYFELTNAVRVGDLELFRTVADKFASTFSADRTRNLIVRLRHNVIRTGLRNISISYSRISLADIAKKLRLDSENPVADAESIVAKAIRDGAIDATIDHANGWMVSKETGDVYSTNEPQIAFNSRIAFCLNMHNEAVKAMRFPPNSHKEKESAEKRRERLQQEEELAKHMAEEEDDDF
ncbi:26S proteasome non-ATPase regulatory subunit 3 homolog A [Zea mays]|uniref:26S proteasome non-ATPase regulatory subunit 3 homolog A n=1 Tax=Zea mays TaxID=4577 RepID=A0A1D6KMZ8_MAIZE|nr:26S proteasome non-ATPase regulatory subunit 3 homolog A [Zea mays]